MIHTNIFATKEEFADLKRLAECGWQNGDIMIVTSTMQGIQKDNATINAEKACHKLALLHGLPEIEGYYGITKKGEFVRL